MGSYKYSIVKCNHNYASDFHVLEDAQEIKFDPSEIFCLSTNRSARE